MKDCLVVGAGLAGLAAARDLASHGWQVLVIDKGSRPGGRMATRPLGEAEFDYGAQYFTVRDPAFAQAVDDWSRQGLARVWSHGFGESGGHPRFAVAGGMNRLPQALAQGLDVRTRVRAVSCAWAGACWQVVADPGEAWEARRLLLTAPVPQSLALLDAGAVPLPTAWRSGLEAISYDPCLALLVRLDGPSGIPAPGGLPMAGPVLSWMADNTQKGLGAGGYGVTLHAQPAFSASHWDAPPETVAQAMLDEAAPYLGGVAEWKLHRWRFAQPRTLYPDRYAASESPGPLVLAGDAFAGPRVEGAWLSGIAAAAWLRQC
jgi:predicted NAD/FAD-dependent oxidoreductase